MVSREVLRCDLDRIKLIIASSKSGIRPASLKIIEEKYRKALRQQRFISSSFVTDQKSIEICERDGILLKETFRPIRCVLYNCYYCFRRVLLNCKKLFPLPSTACFRQCLLNVAPGSFSYARPDFYLPTYKKGRGVVVGQYVYHSTCLLKRSGGWWYGGMGHGKFLKKCSTAYDCIRAQ